MALWTDVITPADLTGFSRTVAEAFDAQGTLATILPNQQVDDVVFSWKVNERSNDVAQYRSFDAETPIGSSAGLEEITAKLAPVGLKKLFGEYDQLRRRGANSLETVQAAADRLAAEVTKATVERVERLRGEALVTGKLVLAENGVRQSIDFGRRADFTKTAATLWSAADADPIADIEAWRQQYVAENGTEPTDIVVSGRVFAALTKSDAVRGYFGTAAPTLLTRDAVNSIVTSYGLPALSVYDRTVGGQRVIADTQVVMASRDAGATVWGTTVEADDPRYGLQGGDLPGLVVGAYKEDDPNVVWIRANAITLPVLANSNLTLAATVL